jgi:hypothetical protein
MAGRWCDGGGAADGPSNAFLLFAERYLDRSRRSRATVLAQSRGLSVVPPGALLSPWFGIG